MQTDVREKLLYADEMTEKVKTEMKMQGTMGRVPQTCYNYELTISTKQTEVAYQTGT